MVSLELFATLTAPEFLLLIDKNTTTRRVFVQDIYFILLQANLGKYRNEILAKFYTQYTIKKRVFFRVHENSTYVIELISLVSLFNDISTFVGYLMPKPSF